MDYQPYKLYLFIILNLQYHLQHSEFHLLFQQNFQALNVDGSGKLKFYYNKVALMKKFRFRIKYYLESLEIKKNALFNNIRLYFIQDNTKTLICSSKQSQGDRVIFETTFQEDQHVLIYKQQQEKYQSSYVTLLLEFEAEQRFIKMGQITIDIASIANSDKKGQVIPYRLEKCFDRNSNLLMSISLSYIQEVTSPNMHDSISKSTYYLPIKSQIKKQSRNANKTQYFELEEARENYSLISEPRTSLNNPNHQRNSHQKTLAKNLYQQTDDNNELTAQIASLRTDLRLTKQELTAVQQKYCELASINENMELELRQAHTQNYKMANICDELTYKVNSLQRTLDNQREVSSSQAQKYLCLYQQSQQVRNKLLLQMDAMKNEQKENYMKLQIKANQSQNRVKKLYKQREELKQSVQKYTIEAQTINKAYEKEKTLRKQLHSQNQKLKETLESINNSIEKLEKDLTFSHNKNQELVYQLELGRFSITELERELTQIRHKMDQKNEMIQKWQKELQKTNQLINEEKFKYNQQINKMQDQFGQQQKNLQQYIEQLQSKTINQYSQLNEMNKLRRQITMLKKKLTDQEDNNKQLQNEILHFAGEKEQRQELIKNEQQRTLQLTKDKIQLQLSLKKMQQELLEMSLNNQNASLSKEEKEALTKKCNSQRDRHWQNQVQKVQTDTLILIEKWKKEKEELIISIQELEVEINSKQDENNQLNQNIRQLKQAITSDRKQIQLQEGQLRSLQIKLQNKETEYWERQGQIQELGKKLSAFDGVQDSLIDLQNKISAKNKEITSLKSSFQREKNIRIKQKVEIKDIVLSISSILTKSQKHKMHFQQFRCQTIDIDVITMLNSSLKIYCDKHNKVKQKLQRIEQLEQELENKEKELDKLSNSRKIEKQLSKTSSKDSLKGNIEIDQHLYMIRNAKQKQLKQIKEESLVSINLLKQENMDLRNKVQKQMDKARNAEKAVQSLEKALENYQYEEKKATEQIENKAEQIADLNLKLTNKENQLHIIKQQLKDTTSELTLTKNRLQEANRILHQQKTRNLFKKGVSLLNSPSKSEESSSIKIVDLEKRLKSTQEQLQRVKRQKQDRRREEVPVIKQIKQLQIKLKQKQNYVLELKKDIQTQKLKFQQEKDFSLSRQKKLKRDHEDQIEEWRKNEKDLKNQITDEQEKIRILQKKIKQLEDNLRAANSQAVSTFEKEEKIKRLINTQWELKLKSVETQHKNQLAVAKRIQNQQKSLEKSLREMIQEKQTQKQTLINELEKKQLKIEDLKAEIEVFVVKLKNLEEYEGQYKQKIEVLQTKIRIDSSRGSRKESKKQDRNYEEKSEFSLGAFTFR